MLTCACRFELQLLLSFDVVIGGGGGGASASASSACIEDSGGARARDGEARAEFKRRLIAWHTSTNANPSEQEHGDKQQAAAAQQAALPLAPLPSRDNAPKVGGSPSLNRSVRAAAGAGSPTLSRGASPTMSRGASLPLPGAQPAGAATHSAAAAQLPPKSPAPGRLPPSAAAAARAQYHQQQQQLGTSPMRSQLPPPSPTASHGAGRAGGGGASSLLARGGSSSILDSHTLVLLPASSLPVSRFLPDHGFRRVQENAP